MSFSACDNKHPTPLKISDIHPHGSRPALGASKLDEKEIENVYRSECDVCVRKHQMDRKYTGRSSFEAEISAAVQEFIRTGVFKNPQHQDHKADLVLRALGHDPSDPPAGFSKATIKKVFRLEWSKQQALQSVRVSV